MTFNFQSPNHIHEPKNSFLKQKSTVYNKKCFFIVQSSKLPMQNMKIKLNLLTCRIEKLGWLNRRELIWQFCVAMCYRFFLLSYLQLFLLITIFYLKSNVSFTFVVCRAQLSAVHAEKIWKIKQRVCLFQVRRRLQVSSGSTQKKWRIQQKCQNSNFSQFLTITTICVLASAIAQYNIPWKHNRHRLVDDMLCKLNCIFGVAGAWGSRWNQHFRLFHLARFCVSDKSNRFPCRLSKRARDLFAR